VPHPESLIRAIADRHGLAGGLKLMPQGGMVNDAWAIGNGYVLRIVMEQIDNADGEAEREAAVFPFVQSAGVTAPRLVAHDSTKEFAPKPYTIYERAHGELIGFSPLPLTHFEGAYRQLGRELFALHSVAVTDELRAHLLSYGEPDIATAVAKTVKAGAITAEEGDDIVATMARLAEIGGPLPEPRLIHNDTHPWNLMADPSTGALTAVIDWGDVSLADPARDFASMPLQTVPAMLDGYSQAGGDAGPQLISRSIVVGMLVALGEMRNPDMANYERRWWRMPPGGWPEMRSLAAQFWPEFTA
jgi:aminoglycoside phosphotransferase (APT) family kinase protein